MRIQFLLLFLFVSFFNFTLAQQTIDGAFDVDNTSKKYSLYIPTSYNSNQPQQLMLGLHPLNTNRWDGEAWRDTLINFSETNNLLLVCPDGGPDGKIDDPIDTTFTSMLLDSVSHWYNINQEEKYIMGFSWGGLTTYTYGLRRTDSFAGYIVIGAAINGVAPISDIIHNAENENFYLVHGETDSPATRYTPLLNALTENKACTESRLMSGVGHTIDFPDRNQILSEAFDWIKNNNCNVVSSSNELDISSKLIISPNPSQGIFKIQNYDTLNFKSLNIYNVAGMKMDYSRSNSTIQINTEEKGLFLIVLENKNGLIYNQRIIIY